MVKLRILLAALLISSVVSAQTPIISAGKVTTSGSPPVAVKVPVSVSAPLNNVKSFTLQFSYDKSSALFNHSASSSYSGISNFVPPNISYLSATDNNGLISLSWVNSSGVTLTGKIFDMDFTYSSGFSEVRFVSATIKDTQGKKFTLDLSNGSISQNTNPAVKVIYPNGGETLEVIGLATTIKWTSIYMTNVNLDYTTDDGSTWQSITTNFDATKNSYDWTIPNTINSSLCKIKVTDVSPAATSDASDATFTINSTPVLNLETPNGGEQLKVGGVKTIKWSFKNVLNVKLEYTTNASAGTPTWTTIAASLPATKLSYEWIIPNSVSADCKVRVVDLANSTTIMDLSNAILSIINTPISVTVDKVVQANVKIIGKVCTKVGFPDLYWWWERKTGVWDSEHAKQTKDGHDYYATDTLTVNGTVPVTVGWLTSLQYLQIQISYDDNILNLDSLITTVDDLKTINYSADDGVINIVWGANTPVDIHGKIFDLKFSYKKFTKPTQWISSNWDYDHAPVADPNTPTATIDPRNFSDLKIITVNAKNSKNDMVDASNWTHGRLSINNNPAVKILSPVPGDTLEVNDVTYPVVWSSKLITNVFLKYSTDNGAHWAPIVNPTAASSGTYLWILPNVNSTNCLLKIADASDSSAYDISPAKFTVTNVKRLNLISPDGGETLRSGSNHTITWDCRNLSNVKLLYSTGLDTTWNIIAASLAAKDYQYKWAVPSINSSTCKVKIIDLGDVTRIDTSLAVFTITTSKVKIKVPDLVAPAGDIVVPVNSEQIFGATYFNFSIKYNTATMVLDTILPKPVLSTGTFYYTKETGLVRIIWFSTTPLDFVGDLCQIKFKSYTGVYSVFQFDTPNQVKDAYNKVMDVEFVNGSIGVTDIEDELIPTTFSLSQNYPNPFNPATAIQYQVPKESNVVLTVYNLLGQRVTTLVDEVKQPGFYTVRWNASSCANGIYFYRIVTKDFVQTKKMILLK